LFAQDALRAASLALASAGSKIAARMPMIAITTNSSINVKPLPFPRMVQLLLLGIYVTLGNNHLRLVDRLG